MKYSNKAVFVKYLSLTSFLCSALAIFAFHGCERSPNSSATYLPESGAIAPWKADGKPKIFKGKELYNYIDGGAELFFEYGFSQVATRRYVSGDAAITVDVYEMNNPRAAFGIYSVQRDYEMPALEVGDDGTAADTVVSFCQERFYVIVTGNRPSDDVKQASAKIAHAVSDKIQKSSPLPGLLKMLPSEHIIPRSTGCVSGLLGLNTQFYLGDSNILGINGSTVECVFAQYRIQEDQAHLLIIKYPDSAAANAALHAATATFEEKYKTVVDKDISVFSDRRKRYYHIAAGDNFVYIISGSDSVDLIREIESSINPSSTKLE